MRDAYALVAYTLAGFVATTIGQEFVKGVGARRRMHGEAVPVAFLRLVGRNRRRYGGYIVHLGVVVLFAAFAGLAFKKEYETLIADKVPHLHYLSGDKLIGDDGEGTVDGSHPTDLGFLRQADVMVEFARVLLPGVVRGDVRVERLPELRTAEPVEGSALGREASSAAGLLLGGDPQVPQCSRRLVPRVRCHDPRSTSKGRFSGDVQATVAICSCP